MKNLNQTTLKIKNFSFNLNNFGEEMFKILQFKN